MTHFEWGWDDNDGQVFKRFDRTLPIEAWLIGYERADEDEREEGATIILVDGKRLGRTKKVIAIPFSFRLPISERAVTLVEAAKEFFPKMPPAELLEELWMHSDPPDVVPAPPRL